MKLILTATVDNLGIAGDVVEVKDGYGRNYLLPRGFAIAYNRGTAKQIEGIKRARDAKQVRSNEHAAELRTQLEELQVKVEARTDASGKLYGALTGNTIAQAIKKAGGPSVDKRAISAAKPIKTTGTHLVSIKLTPAVTAHVPLEVVGA
ncbi:50S ribosomal protein L9 [Propionimicrobium sp. PCR01-08-3]|uniref:50S ribosomal protein L9 n=1 Tax=Propionimicrobium sp. PCR01-08-3 TaxID=3052086 RepID=UPI00255CFE5A|nr:50S ribosomal protein L9 [Propionimicrobium sp. PCR01-08-3]WIY82657.1 50S ribosomal protein L9 [Propionimicrobium sp. PCR01-08-3]